MRNRQRGLSLMALIIGFAILVIVAIFGMKIVPSFLEYRTSKAAIEILARSSQTPADVRKGFDSRAAIDDIQSISAKDLEISREGNQMVIAFQYRKEIPLFRGVGIYIDYAASSKGN